MGEGRRRKNNFVLETEGDWDEVLNLMARNS